MPKSRCVELVMFHRIPAICVFFFGLNEMYSLFYHVMYCLSLYQVLDTNKCYIYIHSTQYAIYEESRNYHRHNIKNHVNNNMRNAAKSKQKCSCFGCWFSRVTATFNMKEREMAWHTITWQNTSEKTVARFAGSSQFSPNEFLAKGIRITYCHISRKKKNRITKSHLYFTLCRNVFSTSCARMTPHFSSIPLPPPPLIIWHLISSTHHLSVNSAMRECFC